MENVGGFEDGFGCSAFGGDDHGFADLFGGLDVLRGEFANQQHKRRANSVEEIVERCFGFDAMEREDRTNAKHIGGFEWQAEESVFGLAFHSCPHRAAFFGAIGAPAGDVDKSHLRIELDEKICDSERQVVIDTAIIFLVHSCCGCAQRIEAGIEAREL